MAVTANERESVAAKAVPVAAAKAIRAEIIPTRMKVPVGDVAIASRGRSARVEFHQRSYGIAIPELQFLRRENFRKM
jgi:hypothetical protein